MSNHEAGHIVSSVLDLLDEKGMFNNMEKKEAAELIIEIGEIVEGYDGNIYEALDDIASKYNICTYCYKYSEDELDEEGNCKNCER